MHVDIRGIVKQRVAVDERFRCCSTVDMADERYLGDAIFYRGLPIRLPGNIERFVPVIVFQAKI